MRVIVFLYCIFVIITCVNAAPVEDGTDDDLPPLDETDCGNYRQLARLPDPFSKRGQVCCDSQIGCFSNEKGSPWAHISQLPECVDKIKPEFYLYTPEMPTYQSIDYKNINNSISTLILSPDRQLFAVIHGFNTKWPSNWMFPMKDALIDLGHNVLLVRWTNGSNMKDYIKAAANTRPVGAAVAFVLGSMSNFSKVNLRTTTIVGFSLGAHVSGYAGRHLPGLKRIIGLDPAGPLFVCEDQEIRLDPTDASFVQAIHTNGDTFLDGGLGTTERMGHVDFYANGGLIQAGCASGTQKAAANILSFNISSLGSDLSCSHKRAPIIFTEMIKKSKQNDRHACSFTTFSCNDSRAWKYGQCFLCSNGNCPEPGLSLDVGSPYRGRYYFNTLPDNVTGTYCGRQNLLTLTSDKNAKGKIVVNLMSDNYDSGPITFQKDRHTIKALIPRSEVIVEPWTLREINQILITYSRYTSTWSKDGTHSFTLTNVTLVDVSGLKKVSCSPVSVNHGQTVSVQLFRTCP